MTTSLPKDSNNNAIQTLKFKSGAAHQITFSGTTTRNSTGFNANTRVVALCATQPCFIAFGGSDVEATTSDHYFPANTWIGVSIKGGNNALSTHIAALQVSSGGTLYISEME